MAAHGVEEFAFTIEEVEQFKTNTFEASVEVKAEMTEEHYNAVKKSMDAEMNDDPPPEAA